MANAISISITRDYVHAVELAINGDKINVKKFSSVKINEPVIRNDTVNIEVLKGLILSATNEMKAKDIYITAPVATGVSNEYILPYDKKDTYMRSMIWGNISSNLSPEKYLMDYAITDTFIEDGAKKCKITAYLMLKSIVIDIQNAVIKAGLNPKCFDMIQNSIHKLYKIAIKDATVLFVNLCRDEVKLHLINPPDSIISRVTAINDGGMPQDYVGNEAYIVASDQISKMFQFQSIKQPNKNITKVYLFGDIANEEALEYLRERNEADIAFIDVPEGRIRLNGADLTRYAYNIGAIL